MPPAPPRERDKRHGTRDEEESQARKKDRLELEDARRALLIVEEDRQLRDIEWVVGASSSRVDESERTTTAGAIVPEDTSEGVPTTDRSGSEQLDPPAC